MSGCGPEGIAGPCVFGGQGSQGKQYNKYGYHWPSRSRTLLITGCLAGRIHLHHVPGTAHDDLTKSRCVLPCRTNMLGS
ncbi:MAG: hypothetical protein FRX48_04049 [Lasallia pustulata]|uniref:Uncharacterized protein n=1 Tax=Lasallia pustulata TaxID=136370 RepID=A0A5M8PQT5_9LECA|nr:MAG: hypothetical protein FRX48_04049 [Lasallia pustulata]